MNIGIIGVGLIGGSFSLAIKEKGIATNVYAIYPERRSSKKAVELGICERALTLEEALLTCDGFVVSVPVDVQNEVLILLLDRLSKNQWVIDMGSTKKSICDAVLDHPKRNQFLAVHPIAGTENSGPEYAFGSLFEGNKNIFCDSHLTDRAIVEKLENIFVQIGMKLLYMNSEEHDRQIAYVSHLSHISSFALGSAVLKLEVNEKTIFNLAGSGFASTARLAKSSPEMWAPILKDNKANVLEAVDKYMAEMQEFRNLIEKEDRQGLTNYMNSANEIRRVLKGLEQNKLEHK